VTSLDTFYDPERNMHSALGRIAHAMQLHDDRTAAIDALEQLEKAHYRLERAQGAVVAQAIADGTTWSDVAFVLGMAPRHARRRFARYCARS
jgi:AraC-like DNA-binding protein